MTIDQQAQERALLAAVLDEPGEDAHRLIYADWLQDHGQEARAEFIRVQVTITRYEACLAGPVPSRLLQREAKLLITRSLGWLCAAGAALESRTAGVACSYRRGFVHAIRCSLAAWEEHGPAVVSRHPVARVEVTDIPIQWATDLLLVAGRRFFLAPVLVRVVAPEFSEWIAASPTWQGRYPDRGTLTDALSRELVAWARSKRGEA